MFHGYVLAIMSHKIRWLLISDFALLGLQVRNLHGMFAVLLFGVGMFWNRVHLVTMLGIFLVVF